MDLELKECQKHTREVDLDTEYVNSFFILNLNRSEQYVHNTVSEMTKRLSSPNQTYMQQFYLALYYTYLFFFFLFTM